jgi:hypothetical protein
MTSDGSLGLVEGITVPVKASGNRRNRRGAAAAAIAAPVTDDEIADGVMTEAQKEKAAKARDNAVTARLTKTKMCHFFERGKCASNDCRYAHSQSELRTQPNLEKTKLCKTFAQDGYCNAGENCGFAHGEAELKVTEGIYKTQMCHFFERGRCLKGDRCNHAHGKEDLRFPVRGSPDRLGQKKQGVSSGGFNCENSNDGAGAGFGATSAAGLGPVGLRSPLSPLPLADLLGDPGANITNTPAPPLPAGLHSPDIFGMSLWTGMPWTPPAFAPLPGQNGIGMPISQPLAGPTNPATPVGGYQGISAIPSTAPPPGMASALGGGLGLGLSPAPGLAPATVGVPEGVRGGLEHARDAGDKQGIVCDLNKRLASLDTACNSLAADVRDLTASGNQAAGERPAAADAGRSERLVHRI